MAKVIIRIPRDKAMKFAKHIEKTNPSVSGSVTVTNGGRICKKKKLSTFEKQARDVTNLKNNCNL